MKKAILFLFIIILPFFFYAEAEGYKIGTYHIPQLVDSNNKGIFIEIFNEIKKRTKINFEIVYKPPKRIFNEFKENRIDAYFPAFKNKAPKNAIMTEPFFFKKTYIFVHSGNMLIDSIEQLEGKRVGLTLGYSYSQKLTSNKKIKFDYNIDIKTSLQKLAYGRIDAFVSDKNTASKIIKQYNLENISCSSKPLSIKNVYFAFQPTKQGKQFATNFTNALKSMKKDGTYDKIISSLIK